MRWCFAGLLALTACAAPPPVVDTPPLLRIAGSDPIVESLIKPLVETHSRTLGTTEFEVAGGGTHQGFHLLLDGEADLVAASRAHLPAEQEQAIANGYSLEAEGARHIAAVDVVAVALHPSNPIESLTYDQVIGIFCTRTLDDWSDLGLDAQPISPVARSPLSGTRVLFEDFFCGPRGIHSTIPVLDNEQIRTTLHDDAGVIGFTTLANQCGKSIGLRPDPEGPAVRPSQQNIIRGAYPLYRDVYLYTAGPVTGDALAFVEWIASPAGQEVVDEARYVPLFLRPESLDAPRPLRETIHFEPEKSTPNQRSLARIELLVDELRDRAVDKRHIILEGYTDAREGNSLELSRARAEAVRDLLSEEIPGLFFEIIPRGSIQPIAPNETPYGRQRNRRVQIYLAEEEQLSSMAPEEG